MKVSICSICGAKMHSKGYVTACPPLTIPMKENLKPVKLTQCTKCNNIEFEWF